MVNFISSWIKSIIVISILMTIIEMIVPNTKSKKYIKIIMGIYMIFVIIEPFINDDAETKLNLSNYIEKIYSDASVETSTKIIDTNKEIQDNYISKMEENIEEEIEELGYIVEDIRLDVEFENEEQYGNIKEIFIQLSEENSKNNINKVKIVNIDTINNIKEKEDFQKNDKKEITELLEENYLIESDKINFL